MKIALISDIHANLTALEAVLAFTDEQEVDLLFCLGDLVGYGPCPNEVCERMAQYRENTVMGNHDYAVGAKDNVILETFNMSAREMCLWTRERMSAQNMELLQSLKMVNTFENMTLVHSTPSKPEEWNYIFNVIQAYFTFFDFTTQICFVGHSHQPYVLEKSRDNDMRSYEDQAVEIKADCKYLINIGSVGQPRDGDPNAAVAILETKRQQGTYRLHRIAYDISQTQQRMRELKLPQYLIDRLENGR